MEKYRYRGGDAECRIISQKETAGGTASAVSSGEPPAATRESWLSASVPAEAIGLSERIAALLHSAQCRWAALSVSCVVEAGEWQDIASFASGCTAAFIANAGPAVAHVWAQKSKETNARMSSDEVCRQRDMAACYHAISARSNFGCVEGSGSVSRKVVGATFVVTLKTVLSPGETGRFFLHPSS